MEEILELAKKLGMMIADSDVAKAHKEAEARHMEDTDAQKIMADYSLKCEQLSEKIKNPDITKEEYDKINLDAQAEYIKITQNETIANYLEANRNFSSLINQVNGIITHFITGGDESACSGNCSGCSGCH